MSNNCNSAHQIFSNPSLWRSGISAFRYAELYSPQAFGVVKHAECNSAYRYSAYRYSAYRYSAYHYSAIQRAEIWARGAEIKNRRKHGFRRFQIQQSLYFFVAFKSLKIRRKHPGRRRSYDRDRGVNACVPATLLGAALANLHDSARLLHADRFQQMH